MMLDGWALDLLHSKIILKTGHRYGADQRQEDHSAKTDLSLPPPTATVAFPAFLQQPPPTRS